MTKRFKAKLAQGGDALVVNVNHPAPGLVERLGALPVDAVFFDCEQGSPGIESVENMARAARLAGVASLCRLHGPDDWLIERYLFRGIDGIVIPRLSRPDQAARVVETVRYCLPRRHDEIAVVIQIETIEAARAVEDFAAVQGIDCLFVGPVDLAKSMGHAGDFHHRAVQAEIDRTIAAIAAAGVAPGMLVNRADAAAYRAKGVRFFYEHVNTLLAYGIEDFLSRRDG